jgi:hypothetical protein
MKRINSFTYDVRREEAITIEVTPTDFGASGPSVEAVLDAAKLLNVGTISHPVYRFPITNPVGQPHRVFMEFTFQFDAPDNAFYQVTISGQNDEGCPCGFIISNADEVKDANIRFRVQG